MMNSFDNLWEW